MSDINVGNAPRVIINVPTSASTSASTLGVASAKENNVVNIRHTERQQTADNSAAKPKTTVEIPVTSEQLRIKVDEINQNAVVRRSLQFSVDDETGTTIITVRDAVTDEVIRQIPSEELVKLAQRLKELDMTIDGEKGVLLTAQA